MPKITHHIPTEQFGFTEVELAETENMPYEEAKSLYGASVASGEGLGAKEWNSVVEHYLNTSELLGASDTWVKLSKYQQDWIQETKRAIKRIEAKALRETNKNEND